MDRLIELLKYLLTGAGLIFIGALVVYLVMRIGSLAIFHSHRQVFGKRR